MSRESLVLSVFPGIDGLGRGFEAEGFCVVRGPDLLWGGDVHAFHPPAGVFGGVIGGPPCQMFSPLARLVRHQGYVPRFGNLIPEFERVVQEAAPEWWLMENVSAAPVPRVDGYQTYGLVLNHRWVPAEPGGLIGPEQHRKRRFTFGTGDGRPLVVQVALFEAPVWVATIYADHDASPTDRCMVPPAVLSTRQAVPVRIGGSGKVKRSIAGTVTSSQGGRSARMQRYSIADAARLQGFPPDFLTDAPFTQQGKLQAIANAVPLPLARALAAAIQRAFGTREASACNTPNDTCTGKGA